MSRQRALMGCLLPALLALVLLVPSGPAGAALSKKESVAVVIHDGTASPDGSGQSLGTAEATILEILLAEGYNVVNPKRMEEIRRSKAARLALEGDVEAIVKLRSQYGLGLFVSGRVSLPEARQNEFGLFTATAELAVEAYATSTGRYVFSGTTSGKQLGYSAGEAREKALQEAARLMGAELTKGESPASAQGVGGGETSSVLRLSLANLSSFSQLNEILATCRHLAGVNGAKATGYANGTGLIEVDYRGTSREFVASLTKRITNLAVTSLGKSEIQARLQ